MTQDKHLITDNLSVILGDEASKLEEELGKFRKWMLTQGKNPDRNKPLSEPLTENYLSRLDQVFRFVLLRQSTADPTALSHDQADQVIKWLDDDEITKSNDDPYSETSKRKFSNCIEKYFEWRSREDEDVEPWSPRVQFSQQSHESADKLNFRERGKLRQEALNYGSLPSYYDADEETRDRINGLVAQRLGKAKSEISGRDWDKADQSNKVGSLVTVALDVGMTPIEIENATVHWFDERRELFEIPEEYAAKNRKTAEVPVAKDTAEVVSRWMRERRHREKYDDTNLLWLNQKGNPYSSRNLCDLIQRLCKRADIPTEDRKIVWYSLRHNLGQSLDETGNLSAANDQLRHETWETTKNTYGGTSIEKRQAALNEVNELSVRAANDPEFDPISAIEDTGPTPSPEPAGNQTHIDAVIPDTDSGVNRFIQDLLAQRNSGPDETQGPSQESPEHDSW